MTLKVTLQMTSGRQTWGETHYLLSPTDPTDAAAIAEVNQLATDRAGCLGIGAYLFAARVGTVDATRNVTTVRYNPPLTGIWPGVTVGVWTADQPNAAVEVSLRTTNLKRQTRLYMAGVPDIVIEVNPAFPNLIAPVPAFIAAFNAYALTLRVPPGTWGDAVKTNPAGAQVQPPLVTNAGFPGLVGATVLAPLPRPAGGGNIGVGDRVQLRGFRRSNMSSRDVNGVWSVAGVLAGAGTVTTYFLQDSVGVDPTNFWRYGLLQTVAIAYDPYSIIDLVRARSRKRGGSIELPRGRSRTRRSRG